MFLFFRVLLLALGFAMASAAQAWSPMTIYGTDDRMDFYELKKKKHIKNTSGVALMIEGRDMIPDNQNHGDMIGISFEYGPAFNLCPNTRFYSQKFLGYCTAFKVGPKTMATAAHCVPIDSEMFGGCSHINFVFDYKVTKKSGGASNRFAYDNVYSCERVLALDRGHDQDYALIQVDRVIKDRPSLALRPNDSIKVREELYIVGHPSGLPMKLSDNAKVRSTRKSFFKANIDSFRANSGSPVFSAKTHEVVGILTGGDKDFSYNSDEGCMQQFTCPDNGCSGEIVVKSSQLLPYLNPN